MRPLELLGRRFDRLLVVQKVNAGRGLKWLAVCECGGTRITRGADLNSGKVKSCGCLVVENNKNRTVHGDSDSRFYHIWIAMRQRCNNQKASRYSYYGGRGIKICEQWGDFQNFKSDMYESYLQHVEGFGEKNTSLDRSNNELGYSPENCKWATQKEQVNNRRTKMKNKELEKRMIRHGELTLFPLDELPEGVVEVRTVTQEVLAASESHHHHIAIGDITVFNNFDAARLIKKLGLQSTAEISGLYRFNKASKLEHQKTFDKHETKPIVKGLYVGIIKKSYDYFAKRMENVRD